MKTPTSPTAFLVSTAFLLCAALMTACGEHDHADHAHDGEDHAGHPHEEGDDHAGDDHDAHEHGDEGDEEHGEAIQLGEVALLGHTFVVNGFGTIEPGAEAAFEVSLADGAELGELQPILWVENAAGEQTGGPESGTAEGHGRHYHLTPSKAGGAVARVVLRLRSDGKDERAAIELGK